MSSVMLNNRKTRVKIVRTESSTAQSQSFSRLHPEWASSLVRAINVLRLRAEDLILELSHNTGGYVCLGLTMIQLFFPDQLRLVSNIQFTLLSTLMMASGAMGIDYFIPSYGNTFSSVYHKNSFLQIVSHLLRNFTYTNYLSDRYAVADRYVLQVDPIGESKRNCTSTFTTSNEPQAYRLWGPENMAILTDAYYGSSCALISSTRHEKFGVRTVIVNGGSLAEVEPMSYSTFPGLQVIDGNFIFNEMNNVGSQIMPSQELHMSTRQARRASSCRQTGPIHNVDLEDNEGAFEGEGKETILELTEE
ncbi:hypothetical protein BGZ50_001301 [Haplosporangium sp. Z 11]|nr:hypothetical protein BGZ50_001301 [Haplosporangium sp. Z 11]